MDTLLLLAPLLAGGVIALGIWWIERSRPRRGLGMYLTGALMVGAALYGFAGGTRLLPALFLVQAVFFALIGRYLRAGALKANGGARAS